MPADDRTPAGDDAPAPASCPAAATARLGAGASVKRATVAVLGGATTLAGIALLVLPGPGFVLIAAGLALLATQFAWAARPLAYAKDRAQVGMDEVAHSRWRTVVAVGAGVGLLTIGVLGVVGVQLPLVNLLTASMLILSGLGLLGTIVYAWRRGGAPRSHRSGRPDRGQRSARPDASDRSDRSDEAAR
ncbi:PGPGW domain-containing protein [Cellulomonas sp. ATA003]|uniref:PGPGW domain-containing protein n=1 Tax=Cellulomonas sp. ATA003 TaxID=3073064 RepID=UPI00287338D6|nr:PGPGW domain-containing protein [Cellulomonas sp. ATA003]WNB86214.1 PGPGW domain-containing protein [Cellulomonas sp. ATA003]